MSACTRDWRQGNPRIPAAASDRLDAFLLSDEILVASISEDRVFTLARTRGPGYFDD